MFCSFAGCVWVCVGWWVGGLHLGANLDAEKHPAEERRPGDLGGAGELLEHRVEVLEEERDRDAWQEEEDEGWEIENKMERPPKNSKFRRRCSSKKAQAPARVFGGWGRKEIRLDEWPFG